MNPSQIRQTHTFATLAISQGAYDEIADALRKAGYDSAFLPEGPISMQGICVAPHPDTHKLDTDEVVRFYEQDFYVLSNFSAFQVMARIGEYSYDRFDTVEQAYHWFKFDHLAGRGVQALIKSATSAHDAFKIAQEHKALRLPNWDGEKIGVMRGLLRNKADQHEYVNRKLLATGERTLIEDSWRDDFWGWGPNRDGQNMLGKLWMEVRTELREKAQ